MDDGLPVIAAAGLDFEAAIARGPGIKVVCGLNRQSYLQTLHEHARLGARGIISFGVSGGLSPHLKAGDVVVASAVQTAAIRVATCPVWSACLLAALPRAHHLPVYGSMTPILTSTGKEALWRATRCVAVDVESQDAAQVAAYYGLPFAVLRIVLDPSLRAIPPSALSGVDEDGKTDAKAVLKSLSRRPQDFRGLMRLANDTRKASLSLVQSRQALGPRFGFEAAHKLVHEPFDEVRTVRRQTPFRMQPPTGSFVYLRLPAWLARHVA